MERTQASPYASLLTGIRARVAEAVAAGDPEQVKEA
jgi:hypothetical protein